MTAFYYSYVAIIGLLLGSFFNVVGLRLPKGESIVTPRSHCTSCKRKLGARELIPVISYIWLRGACRNCGTRISPVYPAIECGTALLFVMLPSIMGWSVELLMGWSLLSLLMIICISDIHYKIIPDRVLLFFAVIFLVLRVAIPLDPWWDMLVGSAIGFGLLLLIAMLSKGGMGGGDIKLFAVLGLVLGWKGVLLAFFLAALIGAITGVIGIAAGKIRRKQPMPFAPAISLGTMIAFLWGDKLVEWYMGLLIS